MRNSKIIYLEILTSLLLLCSCNGSNKSTDQAEKEGKAVELKYAKFLSITDFDDYFEATITNPWDTTKMLRSYHIRFPFKNAAVYILPHAKLLDELGCSDLYRDFSNEMTPNAEVIADMEADAILLSPFENSGGYGSLEKLGMPIVECADYMEDSPLGRAEWIKFYARLFGVAHRGDSLFAEIEKRYNGLCDVVKEKTDGVRPIVTCDLVTGSTWYLPGGNSTIGHLLNDAGGDYIFKENDDRGSLALSPEAAFDKSADADVWLLRYGEDIDKTYKSLKDEYLPYSQIKAFKQGNIFGCNLNKKPYFEECPFNPDLLLRDIIKVLHPEMAITGTSDNETRYFSPLKKQ